MKQYYKKLKTSNSDIIRIPTIKEKARGNLSFCEISKHIPFNIKRAYWIYNVSPTKIRGNHAHKKTEQVLFCLRGSIKINLDDGKYKDSIILNEPDIGIFLGRMLWHQLVDFQRNTILLILASHIYDEKDCIRNYNDFKTILKKLKNDCL